MAEEVFAGHHETVRYETAQFRPHDIRSVLRYAQKYRTKKYAASQELVRHFDRGRKAPELAVDVPPAARLLKVSLVGDIMWMRKGWNDFMSDEVTSFLRGRDIVLGNLETPVSSAHKVIEFLPDLPFFNSPPAMLDPLARCFSALSLANNHCLDKGMGGLLDTIGELDARKILHAGCQVQDRGHAYTMIRAKSLRVAFLAYSWGVNDLRRPQMTSDAQINLMNLCDPSKPTDYTMVVEHIRKARNEKADIIICSLHWGHEFEMYPTFHMMKVARRFISLGVDVIMGHHPHVLQPYEIIDVNADRPFSFTNVCDPSNPRPRQAVVTYSLGNFVSAMFTRECRESCIFNIDFIEQEGRLDLHTVSCLPIYCRRKQRGLRTSVIDLHAELRKPGASRLKQALAESCRAIAGHVGAPLLSTGTDLSLLPVRNNERKASSPLNRSQTPLTAEDSAQPQ